MDINNKQQNELQHNYRSGTVGNTVLLIIQLQTSGAQTGFTGQTSHSVFAFGSHSDLPTLTHQ